MVQSHCNTLYAPLKNPNNNPDIHQIECICGWLLHAALWVSEKNSSRKLADQTLLLRSPV